MRSPVFELRRGRTVWTEHDCESWVAYAFGDGRGERRFWPTDVGPPSYHQLHAIAEISRRVAPWLSYIAVGPALTEAHLGEYLDQERGVLLAYDCVGHPAELMGTCWHEFYHAVDRRKLSVDERSTVGDWLGIPATLENAHERSEAAAEAFTSWVMGAGIRTPPDVESVFRRIADGGYPADDFD